MQRVAAAFDAFDPSERPPLAIRRSAKIAARRAPGGGSWQGPCALIGPAGRDEARVYRPAATS
ncbi:MAG TPA: hypothetical protein VFG79_10360, partial [Solirubrobacter sp.]|nr:hypothetical protein [Solirubrobacter sp.]